MTIDMSINKSRRQMSRNYSMPAKLKDNYRHSFFLGAIGYSYDFFLKKKKEKPN